MVRQTQTFKVFLFQQEKLQVQELPNNVHPAQHLWSIFVGGELVVNRWNAIKNFFFFTIFMFHHDVLQKKPRKVSFVQKLVDILKIDTSRCPTFVFLTLNYWSSSQAMTLFHN
jgi:hypothetical protein